MADISDKAKKPSNDKQKPIRKSTRLQERVAQQSEPLDVGAPTSMDYTTIRSKLSFDKDIGIFYSCSHQNACVCMAKSNYSTS